MKYLKTLALLLSLSSLATLTSCSEGFEDFPSDIEQKLETKSSEPNDSTGNKWITIDIEEPETEDIDCTITLP